MIRFNFAVFAAAALLLLQAPATHAQWSKGSISWTDVVVSGNDAFADTYVLQVNAYSELPTATTPNDTDNISAYGYQTYVWQGSGQGSSINYDLTGKVWGILQGLDLNGGGNAGSNVDSIAGGYIDVMNTNYAPPDGVSEETWTFSPRSSFTSRPIELIAATHLFHGSMGGGTASANAIARATFSDAY